VRLGGEHGPGRKFARCLARFDVKRGTSLGGVKKALGERGARPPRRNQNINSGTTGGRILYGEQRQAKYYSHIWD